MRTLKQMIDNYPLGTKISRVSFEPHEYCAVVRVVPDSCCVVCEDETLDIFHDLNDEGWFLWKEPKEQVKKYLYFNKNIHNLSLKYSKMDEGIMKPLMVDGKPVYIEVEG